MIFQFGLALLGLSMSALGALEKIDKEALTMVPKGTIFIQTFREMTVKTTSGTKVKIEFERQGRLQEGSGLNLNRGDEFEPGSGLISLSSAAQAVAQTGHQVKGEWNLEKDSQYGWIYELLEEKQDNKTFHLVNAKTGKVIRSVNVNLEIATDAKAASPPIQPEAKQ